MTYLFCTNSLLKECRIHYFALNDLLQEYAIVNKNLCCNSQNLNFFGDLHAYVFAACTDFSQSPSIVQHKQVISDTGKDIRIPIYRES